MKSILLFAGIGATLLLAIYLLVGKGAPVSPHLKRDVANNENQRQQLFENDRNRSDNDNKGSRRNGGGNSPNKQDGDGAIGEELPWLDSRDTFEKRMRELEDAVAAESVDHHDIGAVRAILPDGLTDSEKYLKHVEADFADEKKERVRACATKAIAVISKRLIERITVSKEPATISATTYSLESAISLLHRVASPEDFDLFQRYFLQFREGEYEGQRLLILTLLSIMTDLDKEKSRIWVTGILSSNGDYGRSFTTAALTVVKDYYRSEEFIPYIKTIATNHPRPPEIVYDRSREDIVYRVEEKDTLWSIAEKFYEGRKDLSSVIVEANKELLTDRWGKPLPPNRGQSIKIPCLTKETLRDMSLGEFDYLYDSILETLKAIGSEDAQRLISEISAGDAMRHRRKQE